MTLQEKERQELIKYRTKQAIKQIEEVQFLIDNNKMIMAVNRIYYGMFYVLCALSLKNNFSTKKHTQLIGWFNKNYINNQILEKNMAKYFAMLMKNAQRVITVLL